MAQVDGVFAEKLQTNVRDSKVLMVGAGGIGCELLKNLVLSGRSIKIAHVLKFSLSLARSGLGMFQFLTISSPIKAKFAFLACIATAIVLFCCASQKMFVGFKDITIIDLDTIDVSNLNRQFLFQKKHVGKSKSACAKEAALR